ncbi:class I adenylate-forming enzyme family protein [Arthrobacter sp. NPDC058097]|uniref:class I adenylate-forming enzyme family protein n=1 Tax=Arthrobacter sp. NPDC058097 TaxID=3346340 RepID=UPI0036DD39D6
MDASISWITDAVVGRCPSVSPDTPAIAVGSGDPITYGELRQRELSFARALLARGVRKGDRVAILLRNSADYIAWLLAIGRIGAICVRMNWRLTGVELVFQAQDSRPVVFVFDPESVEAVGLVHAEAGVMHFVINGGFAPEWATTVQDFVTTRSEEPFPNVNAEDPLTLMYTSGTTGKPKGTLLTHGNTLWIGAIQIMSWKLDRATVALNMGPLFHAGGFEVLILPTLIAHGLVVTYPSGGFALEGLLQAARRHQATAMLAYSFLLYEFATLDGVEEKVPASLRRIVTGGDTIMPWAYDVFEEKLPKVNLTQSYSLTEGGAVAVHLDHSIARGHESSVGIPQPMTQVQVLDENGAECEPGEAGEICLRSPGVSVGYWERPEATAETFVDGWCRTGDLGRMDAGGFLTLAGRAKDMIRSGGENVYPAEIEKLLTELPDVHDAAVIGVPHEKYVEVGCAVVVLEQDSQTDVEDLFAFLDSKLARYKIPKHIVFVEELPRNAGGKVLKAQLRKEYSHLGNESPITGTINPNTRTTTQGA